MTETIIDTTAPQIWGYEIALSHDDEGHANGTEPLHGALIIYLEDKPKRGYAERASKMIAPTLCPTCKIRKVTETINYGGHGLGYSCRLCLLQERLKYAQEASAQIPELEYEINTIMYVNEPRKNAKT
jgi:hypothetical protein